MNPNDATGFSQSTVLRCIVGRAVVDPNHEAVQDLDRALSYAELVDEVAQLGAALSKRAVGRGDRVALFIPNSVDFVVVALACLWVGAIFVPLALTDPRSRIDTVLQDCLPTLVVTSMRDAETPLGRSPEVTVELLREECDGHVDAADSPSLPAYLIYTSGTTGSPKGVQISNKAFAAAVHSTASALDLNSHTRTLCVSPFHFDGSYANLFPTLVCGGTAVIRPRDTLLYPQTFFNTVNSEKINYSGFTPSYLRLLLASRRLARLNGSTLTTVAFGGEALTVADLRALWAMVPGLRVFNRYGPTETSIAVTNTELTPDLFDHGAVPIGSPHAGVTFVLLDDGGQIILDSYRTGELYIGGVQLMDGYWADPLLTSKVMRRDILPEQILYRTGDLVYRDEFGNYVYVDRADRVVKRSGVRISLVELSELMNKLEIVESATCLTFDRDGELGIVAFIVMNPDLLDVDFLRAARELIPENMLPDRVERVTALPLNRSNQLDESQLLAVAHLKPFRRATG